MPFLLVCASSFAFFASFYLLLPVLPIYVQALGAREVEVGLVIGAFSITALAVRPWVGRSVDEEGRRLSLVAGTLVVQISAVAYIFTRTFTLLLGLRLFHGAGIGFFTTAASTAVADLAPAQRRGEAMGYYGTANNLAMGVGPAIGAFLLTGFDFVTVFLASAGVALVAVLLTLPIPETRPPAPPRHEGLPLARPPLFSRRALLPAVVMVTLTVTYGALISFLPLLTVERNLGNVGLFFTFFALSLILVRAVAGALSDRFGRGAVILPGLALTTAAVWLLALADSVPILLLVAVLYGAGFASVQPALMAFTVDRIGAEARGPAMGTFTAAFDLGVSLGAFVGGPVLQATDFGVLYLAMGAVPLLGMVAFAAGTRRE